jgi:RimJ/RimL family protein N-acetyltransferase
VEPTEITAGRLHLRPPGAREVEAIHAACQDPSIQRWTHVPAPYERVHAEQFVAATEAQWAAGLPRFAVLDITTEQLLAVVSLLDGGGRTHIGYWVAPWARGAGVATEAVDVLCRFAFTVLGLHRIEWTCLVGNWASRAVAERAGFVVEGIARSSELHRGVWHDVWLGGRLHDQGL